MYNAGFGARLYASEWINLSLQADAFTAVYPELFGDETGRLGALTLTPRVMTSANVDQNRPVYGGFQANIITPLLGDSGFEPSSPAAMGGVVVGIDYWFRSSGAGIQAELILVPVGIDQSGDVAFVAESTFDELDAPPVGQISFSGYYRTPPEKKRQRDLEPTPERHRPSPRETEPPPRQTEPEPEPRWEPPPEDEDGVPVY